MLLVNQSYEMVILYFKNELYEEEKMFQSRNKLLITELRFTEESLCFCRDDLMVVAGFLWNVNICKS